MPTRESPARSAAPFPAPRQKWICAGPRLSPEVSRKPAIRWPALLVFALAALYATMSWTASFSKGLSFDEGLQLAVGYNIWLNDDYRIEGANGDLIKRWATLPYLVSQPGFVGAEDEFLKEGAPYELAFRFFFESGNQPEWLLLQGRAMVALLGVATALLVFWCSREIFGVPGGLISLALFVFSPSMLAFGGIVSTDMSIALTLFGSTWAIWRLMHEVTAGRIIGSVGLVALMVLAKPTALAIIPLAAFLIAIKLIGGRPLVLRWRDRCWLITRRRGQAIVLAGFILLHAFAGWAAIWANYDFRYEASPNPADPSLKIFQLTDADDVPGPLERVLRWTEKTRFLPEGYRRGLEHLLGNDDLMPSFMNGKWTIGGNSLFFPYALWVKIPPALMALLVLGGVVLWRAVRIRNQTMSRATSITSGQVDPYHLSPYVVLTICYGAIAMTEDLNIGHRHILPIFPCLYVLAGASGLAWRWGPKWIGVVVGVALAWMVVESLSVRPHYLAFFGPQAGGPAKGHEHLVDSSLDWGMNLPGLRSWLDEYNPGNRDPVYLAYFGSDSPRHHGIVSRRLPGFFDRRKVERYALGPGYYAISATLFRSVYTIAFGPWSETYENHYQIARHNIQILEEALRQPDQGAQLFEKLKPDFWENEFSVYDHLRFARLCAWLRNRSAPIDHVGHGILIWKLGYEDLQAALLGPPVELTADPPPARQFGRYRILND